MAWRRSGHRRNRNDENPVLRRGIFPFAENMLRVPREILEMVRGLLDYGVCIDLYLEDYDLSVTLSDTTVTFTKTMEWTETVDIGELRKKMS